MDDGATDLPKLRRERLGTSDGQVLDARIQGPSRPGTTVVWCHPHPLMGGTMFAPLMTAVADGLADAGVGVVRFDFRGVGASSGQHDGGVGEVNDVAAAVARAAEISPTVVLAGWSFGALVALEFITDLPEQHPYIGVAPPITDRDTFAHVHGAGVTFVIGSRDQVVDNDATLALARTIGASVRRVDTDHFFLGHSVPVVETILDACG